jgi:signal transduction histidine kinase
VRASTLNHEFELSVANAGHPIPQEAMARLFLPFSRGRVQSSQQGLGLGLYISAEIAKAHGGTLDAVSSEAETRFTFRMPIG